MLVDPNLLETISDLFVNFAAGWFGVAFIAPNFTTKKPPLKFLLLTFDLLAGILFLLLAYVIKA